MLRRIATRASSSKSAQHLPHRCPLTHCPLRPHQHHVSPPTQALQHRFLTSSSSHTKQFQSRRGRTHSPRRKPISAWRSREKLLRSELTDLERKLDRVDKREAASEAAKDLPELDDEALDEVYRGLEAPEELSREDRRLLESGQRKVMERRARVMRLVRGQGAALNAPDAHHLEGRAGKSHEADNVAEESSADNLAAPLSFFERIQQRLDRLAARLSDVETKLHQEGSPSTSQAGELISEIKDDVEAVRYKAHTLQSQQSEANHDAVEEEGGHEQFETIHFDEEHKAPKAAVCDSMEEAAQEATSSILVKKLEELVHSAEAAQDNDLIASIQPRDWSALGTTLVLRGQQDSLIKAFNLLSHLSSSGSIEPNSLVSFHESVADAIASYGDSARCEAVLARMEDLALTPTPYAYHALAKAYLRDPAKGLSSALALIDHIENSTTVSAPPSQATYSLILSALLDEPNFEVKDEAWGLWYRMRLNAHPVPDAVVWSNMLRACALGSTPSRHAELGMEEGHRGSQKGKVSPSALLASLRKKAGQAEADVALDLFREMTIVHGIRPTPACYDHLILALCRGPGGRYLEGFRLLSERITLAREAAGGDSEVAMSSYEPSRLTFNALLEGCRRHADVLRARWVLAEMIRSSAPLWATPAGERETRGMGWRERAKMELRMPDAESLGKLFLTYAAWTPTTEHLVTKKGSSEDNVTERARHEARGRTHSGSAQEVAAPPQSTTPPPNNIELSQPAMDEAASEFSSAPPTTSADVVREIRGLLARAIADHSPQSSDDESSSFPTGPLSCVTISTRLLNSYVTALAAHTPRGQRADAISAAVRGEQSLFTRLGCKPNGRTFLIALQACFTSASADGRSTLAASEVNALSSWAWSGWRDIEGSGAPPSQLLPHREANKDAGLDRRTRELIWGERIRLLAKQGRLDEALQTLREFTSLYPPRPRGKVMGEGRQTPVFSAEKDGPVREGRRRPFFDFDAVRSTLQRLEEGRRTVGGQLQLSVDDQGSEDLLDGPDAQTGQAAIDTEKSTSLASSSPATPITARRKPPALWQDMQGRPTSQPPSLSFYELNLLHQRLLEATERPTREQDIGFVGWLCRTWESVEKGPKRRRDRKESGKASGVMRRSEEDEREQGEAEWFGEGEGEGQVWSESIDEGSVSSPADRMQTRATG
ncbi:hypothetical protein BDZ90DRAFT_131818 [Jaminaea rosea]|uniref:Pentacotripeptide-repeat region of PRORP domain-containing protein n=1 Tax=Jaminaea rosea TaxID=1569628 RepID=A0A316UU46_9BASI|nr:hypothetical protein BDZ90DRAFT_131818 [Jaminaea rosea]PWN28827.1 hypothetical protein BDZ90DRAFT_131818 [Jaminaea rosea]